MKKNVGSIDKIIRIILAIILGYFAYSTTFETTWLQYVLYVIAAVLLLTTFIGYCPLYSVFKCSTNKAKE